MGAQRLPEDANARGTVPFDTFDTIARASDQWASMAETVAQLEGSEQLGRVEALEVGEQVVESGDIGADDVVGKAPCEHRVVNMFGRVAIIEHAQPDTLVDEVVRIVGRLNDPPRRPRGRIQSALVLESLAP